MIREMCLLGCAALGALCLLSGCGSISDPQRPVDQAQLVDGLADRVSQAQDHPYTAVYLLPGGAQATMARAQLPTRSAFHYPGGELMISPSEVAVCHLMGPAATCTLSAPASTGPDPSPLLADELARYGLIAPSSVVNLLTTAAVDHNAVITQHDTTIAGQDATCLQARDVGSADEISFAVCITDDGMVGSFTGTVSGASIDLQLDRYTPSAGDELFALPAGAHIVDDRSPGPH